MKKEPRYFTKNQIDNLIEFIELYSNDWEKHFGTEPIAVLGALTRAILKAPSKKE